ncbi:hypothetical protein LPJ61_001032 [Coemansia biformis]|uniref:BZIP domain-containing protein n=1 Tax=Coemansia biformis TaxID=1286918 RepID=A0A9W7YAR8_9FUNG|nr:hypothetical protein LPJ61_001032 [Coemansia biformis]
MSLSRLPQVALRRLVPAITAMPKSLDDDQLKKMMEQQQQQQQQQQQHTGASMKARLAGRSEHSSYTAPQGVVSALAKSSAAVDPMPSAIGRLLVTLGSSSQGMLSSQDLALIKAAVANDVQSGSSSLLTTPDPGSPVGGALPFDLEPAGDMLDAASIDALARALRGTVAISGDGGAAEIPAAPEATATTFPTPAATAAEDEAAEDEAASDDDELPPISMDLSATERRKEQNRRAQKKFRQKDKVRQKEVKWRASQYDTLVESNKRFKRDIDDISRERDTYRRILEDHGIAVDGSMDKKAHVCPLRSPSSTVVASPLSPPAPLGLMDQIAQDTFGTLSASPFAQATSTMNDLLAPFMFAAVKADPMFGSAACQPPSHQTLAEVSLAAAGPVGAPAAAAEAGVPWLSPISTDSLLVEPPLVVDHGSIDAHFAHQTTLDSQFVDPTSFIDELLTSPGFPLPTSLPSPASSSATVSRKRSFYSAML